MALDLPLLARSVSERTRTLAPKGLKTGRVAIQPGFLLLPHQAPSARVGPSCPRHHGFVWISAPTPVCPIILMRKTDQCSGRGTSMLFSLCCIYSTYQSRGMDTTLGAPAIPVNSSNETADRFKPLLMVDPSIRGCRSRNPCTPATFVLGKLSYPQDRPDPPKNFPNRLIDQGNSNLGFSPGSDPITTKLCAIGYQNL